MGAEMPEAIEVIMAFPERIDDDRDRKHKQQTRNDPLDPGRSVWCVVT